ncbi:MAG: caspase family protein, partial [Bacteroidota bacterium]
MPDFANGRSRGISQQFAEKYTRVSKSKNYILGIGIDNYQYLRRLHNAVLDVDSILSVLVKQYQFQNAEITKIYNEKCTRSNILRQLRYLVQRVKETDNLIIYYSGHGIFDEQLMEGYWVPVDARSKEETIGEYISNADIQKHLSRIKSRHTILFNDSCFSGSIFGVDRNIQQEKQEVLPSRWAFTSGRKEVVQDGVPGEHSPFAKSILRVLEENRREKLFLSELVNLVTLDVDRNTNQTPRGSYLQNTGDRGGNFAFYSRDQEERFWKKQLSQPSPEGLIAYQRYYPLGSYINESVDRIKRLVPPGKGLNPLGRPVYTQSEVTEVSSNQDWQWLVPIQKTSSATSWSLTQLETFLNSSDYRKADIETSAIILKYSGLKSSDWMGESDVALLPKLLVEELSMLWENYSDGRFGFRKQYSIWKYLEETGGKNANKSLLFEEFSQRVGWA